MKALINNNCTLHWDCFYIKRVKCIPCNKTSTNKRPSREFYGEKKREKWDIFNFSDFDRDLPIFQFYQLTIDTVINMAVYLRTRVLKPSKNGKFIIFTPPKWFKNNNILPLPL